MNKASSRGGAPGSTSTTANNANNYYGFSSSPTSASAASSNSNVNDNEVNGGGLSFVIHSASHQNMNNNHNQNQILLSQQQQQPSISSVGSSTSSGISSGSSTITKSSTFNGNTFTRSKPKERKPIPNAWGSGGSGGEQDIEDHHQSEHVAADVHRKDAGPFLLQGKGIIPSVTLSEATPSPKNHKGVQRHHSQGKEKEPNGRNSQDLYYFDTSNSNSSGGSVILTGRKSTSFQENSGVGEDDDDHSVFQPGACSTFILTEGEDLAPGESDKGNSAITKKLGKNGIRKMKGDIVDILSSSESQLVDKTSSSGGNSEESSTGSSGDALVLNGSQISGEEENFECLGDGSESFTFQESSTSGSGEASLQFAR